MSRSGLEALLDDREWSGVPPECPEWFGGLPRCPAVIGRSSRVSGSGRDTLSDVPVGWEALPMSGSFWEALPNMQEAFPVVQELSGGLHECPGVVWRPSRISGSGLEALQDVQE